MEQIEQQLRNRTIEVTDNLENFTGGRTVWQYTTGSKGSITKQIIETNISEQVNDERHMCEGKKLELNHILVHNVGRRSK